jgi:hypothetical protein
MNQLEYQDAIEERQQQDRAFKFSEELQTLACDSCGSTGNAHCFGRFGFRGEAPTFLCVDCILNRAGRVVEHCKQKGVVISYKKPNAP